MSHKKRKRHQKDVNAPESTPPKKRARPTDENAPKCPNPYKRHPSQLNGLSPTSSEEYDNTRSNRHNKNTNRNKNDKSKSTNRHPHKKNHRKSVPSLRTSQESLDPSTPTPPPNTNTTNIPSSPSNQTRDVRIELNKAKHAPYVQPHRRRTVTRNADKENKCVRCCTGFLRSFFDKGWMWILLGTAVGYVICYGIMWIKYHGITAKPFDNYTYVENINGSCPCDINKNKTCIECKNCMDKYWDIAGIYRDCVNNNHKLVDEISTLKDDIKKLKDGGYVIDVPNECDKIKSELKKCNEENEELKKKIEAMKLNNCIEYIEEISELRHELGECNVELGSCEQLGRQKDKLDEKRMQEIQKQKRKFELCNEQLKRYKDEAKKNRGKK